MPPTRCHYAGCMDDPTFEIQSPGQPLTGSCGAHLATMVRVVMEAGETHIVAVSDLAREVSA